MHHVDAEISGPGDSGDCVEIGAVHVDPAARLVDHAADVLDALLEQPQGVGVGDHQAGRRGVEERSQGLEVAQAPVVRLHGDHLEPGEGAGCGIGAVGGVGNQDGSALGFASGIQPGPKDHQGREFSLRPCGRVKGDSGKTCGFGQIILQPRHHGEGSLDFPRILEGV